MIFVKFVRLLGLEIEGKGCDYHAVGYNYKIISVKQTIWLNLSKFDGLILDIFYISN